MISAEEARNISEKNSNEEALFNNLMTLIEEEINKAALKGKREVYVPVNIIDNLNTETDSKLLFLLRNQGFVADRQFMFDAYYQIEEEHYFIRW